MLRTALVTAFTLCGLLSAGAQNATVPEGRPSSGVDSRGGSGSSFDPTKNVLDLVGRGEQRQDDLRHAARELFDAKLSALNELTMLRSRLDRELIKAAADRLDSEAKLRSDHAAAILATEKDRVNAIRSVDVGALAFATQQATATAAALAKTVHDTAANLSTEGRRQAEDLRKIVETTTLETNRNLQQQFTSVVTRIAALEAAAAEGAGRRKFEDPMMGEVLKKVEALTQSRAAVAGAGEGRGDAWALIAFGLMFIIALVGAGAAIVNALKRPKSTA